MKLNEAAIAITLLATLAAIVVVTITSGTQDLAATGLRDVAIALVGALAGTTVRSNGNGK